jgi:hypothetical protein
MFSVAYCSSIWYLDDCLLGETPMKLNEALLKKQCVTEDEEFGLLNAYAELKDLLENPELYENPVQMIEELEFELQELWHFPQDRNYHRYWKRIKGCCCPSHDNEDPMYFGRRITVSDCPYHWKCVECGNTGTVGHKLSCSKRDYSK